MLSFSLSIAQQCHFPGATSIEQLQPSVLSMVAIEMVTILDYYFMFCLSPFGFLNKIFLSFGDSVILLKNSSSGKLSC